MIKVQVLKAQSKLIISLAFSELPDMARIFNQYSFLLLVVIPATLFILFLLFVGEGSRLKQVAAVLVLAAVVGLFFLIRPGASSASGSEVEKSLARSNRPILLEIYSNY